MPLNDARQLLPARRFTVVLSKKSQLIVVVATAVAILALFGLGGWATSPTEARVDPVATPGMFRPTETQWHGIGTRPVELRRFRSEYLTDGRIAVADDHTTPVFSPYSGRVTKLFVKAGDTVAQGDPLMAIEGSEFVQGQTDLIAAAAALNTARSQLRLAEVNERRQNELYVEQAGARKDWEQSQAELEAARNALRSAETALAAVRNRLRILGKSDREIGALEHAQRLDPEAIVVAPISGTVTQRQVGLGQFIQSGSSSPVFTIGDLSTVWLVANVRETDAPSVRVGLPVEVSVLAYPDRIFHAKVSYVASSIDASTHRLGVRAEVENADRALKAEMFAAFRIITGEETEALSVPQSAVVYEGESARVWLAGADRTISSREIRVGRVQSDFVEVLSGLTAGETVVTAGSLFIDRAARGE